MIDKAKFLMELAVTIDLARKEQSNTKNAIDMRLFIGDDVNHDIYGINKEEIDSLYETIKNEEQDWFIDFYENFHGENYAEYIDVTLWKNDVDDKVEEEVEEEPIPQVYRFLTTNIEYGYIDVVATNIDEARDKALVLDGDYFVHDSEVSDVQFEEII